MALKVLLRRTIEGVGEVGEIVKVKPGFARNYLFPYGYAALPAADAMRQVVKDKEVEAVRQGRLAAERAQIAERLQSLTLTLEARAGEDGHLYGSVGVRQILDAFQLRGYRLIDRQVRFETVRELGEYECAVALSTDSVVTVKVWVVQDATDALSMAEDIAKAAGAKAAGAKAAEAKAAEAKAAEADPVAAAASEDATDAALDA
ncbi:MAG: 50S ribosomal protein L9 [Planctomycetota bacterium]|nr:50S ribosomal protein L9 [Planctomycetota bacterium]